MLLPADLMFSSSCLPVRPQMSLLTPNEQELKNISLRFERLSAWPQKVNRGVATQGVEYDTQEVKRDDAPGSDAV